MDFRMDLSCLVLLFFTIIYLPLLGTYQIFPHDNGVTGWGINDRGVSFVFGSAVVQNFLSKHDCSLIVRAHQVVEDGYQFFARRSLLTLFSAPNYCGEFDNAGAVMGVSEDLTCWFSILPPDKKKTGFKYK